MSMTYLENAAKTRELKKPLFVDGMFNGAGRRSHFIHLPKNGDYDLYLRPNNDNLEECLLYVAAGDYAVPLKMTFRDFVYRCGANRARQRLYGEEMTLHVRAQRIDEASPDERVAICQKEEALATEIGMLPDVQTAVLKAWMEKEQAQYRDAVQSAAEGKYEAWPSYVGAAILGEIPQCIAIAQVYKERAEERDVTARAERMGQKRASLIEMQKQTEASIRVAIADLKAGKMVDNAKVSIVDVDGLSYRNEPILLSLMERYGINVPARTRGWMIEKLASLRINADESISTRYSVMRHPGKARLPDGVRDRLFELAHAIKQENL